ncbi:MAG: sigma 54-interacting transcriptional regulator [Planctomycetota bacterium]
MLRVVREDADLSSEARSAKGERVQHLRRGFRARAAMRHPGLAQAFETGAIVGTQDQFFTSEHVVGPDLYAASEGWDEARIAATAAQLLRALAFLHGRGVVGVDLRCESIRVVGEEARLLDVGLSARDREVDGVPIRGPLGLPAPERLLEGPEDPRSDLWALGVSLYRVVARRGPFEGEGLTLLRAVVGPEAPPPKGTTPAISQFIMKLLARDPASRPSSANEAIRLLSSLTGRECEVERELGAEVELPEQGPSITSPLERALALMRDAFDGKRETPPLLVVHGDAGSGKSRLVAELRLAARIEGAKVLEGACLDGADGPLGPFAAIDAPPSRTTKSDPSREPARPVLAGRRGEADSVFGSAAEQDRARAAHHLSTMLVEASRQTPLLVVVEDAQWADDAAIASTRHIARALDIARQESDGARPTRMLVVVATRGGTEPFSGVRNEVLRLAASSSAIDRERERLRALSRTERHVVDLMAVLHAEVSVDLMARASGIEADAVYDLLSSLVRRGTLSRRGTLYRVARHAAREAAYSDLDAKRREALHRIVAAALEASHEADHRLAEHLDRGGQADRAIEAYVRAARTARRGANPGRALAFARRAFELAQAVPAQRKRAIEALAEVEAWCGDLRSAIGRFEEAWKDASLPPADQARVLRRLAETALEAGDTERAFSAASEAHARLEAAAEPGDRAAIVAVLVSTLVERGEADAAISGARKMLDQLPKGSADAGTLSLRMALAAACRVKGDRARALSELEGCLTWARKQSDGGASLVAVLATLADVHASVGDHVRALQCLAEALEAAGKAQDLPAMWRVHVATVGLHARQGSADLAGVHLKEAERLARRIGSPQALGYVHGALGGIALEADKPEAALAHFQKAMEVARAAGAAGQEARHLANVGVALWRLGRHEEAERAFREGAETGTTATEWSAVVRCQAKLAEMAVSLGMLAEASQAARRAAEVAAREGMPREAARAEGTLAEAALLAGRADEAVAVAERSARTWREARVARRLCPVLSTFARALAETGRHEEALAAADEALRLLDRVGVRAVRADCLVAKVRVLLSRAAASAPERRGELVQQALPLAREAVQIAGAGGWAAQIALAQVRAAQRDMPAAREQAGRAAAACREEASKLPARMAEAFLARRDVREALNLATTLAETAPAAGLSGDERARFLELLRVTRDLTRERDLETLLRSITENVIRLFRADRGLLILADDGQLRCKVARTSDGQGIPFSEARVEDGVVDAVLRGGTPVVTRDRQAGTASARAVACLPLTVHERALGVLYLEGETFAENDIEVMLAFASGAAIAIENANLYGQTIVDDFTGLKSHRYFMLRLREEVRRARRLERPVALVHVDVDRLKLVNDIHGPEGGNTVILGVAQILTDLLRQDDTMVVAPKRAGGEKVLGRIEGGKFELLLPDTDSAGAAAMAERVLERVRAIAFSMGKTGDSPKALVTASAGVAAFPVDAPDAEQIALKAGEALYTAKRNGRDRVFAYGTEAGVRDDAAVKGGITDPDFDAMALSRDGRTFMGMVSRVLDCGLDLEKMLEVSLKLVVDVTGAERGIILLKEPGGFLRPRCAHAIPYEELEGKAHAVSYTLVRQVAKSGQPVLIRNTTLDANVKDQASVIELSLKSILCAPIALKEEVIGVFYLDTTALDREFTEEHLALLMAFARKIGSPLQASCLHQWHAEETRMLRRALDDLGTKYSYDQIVGVSKPMQDMFKLLDKITPTQFPVLIHGESGTGKELVARAIHFNGPRKGKPFVAENCAALPETLLESELFGHVKGAFTGADRDKKGLFELASGGTLLLDEVGDMGPEMQKALLRVLQEGEIRPVGGKGSVKVDVRIIAATHRKLDEMAKEGKFREDLFYRLNVIGISIPPLRERREDIPYLVHHFLETYAKGTEHPERKIERGAMEAMVSYDWPGNIRELENEVKKLVAMGGEVIGPDQLSPQMRKGAAPVKERTGTRVAKRIAPRATLEDIEKDAIVQSLKEHEWNVRATARALGIDRMALTRRMEKYGIEVPDKPQKPV